MYERRENLALERINVAVENRFSLLGDGLLRVAMEENVDVRLVDV